MSPGESDSSVFPYGIYADRSALDAHLAAEHFSWWMTFMLHKFHDDSPFQHRLQLAELDYVVTSKAKALTPRGELHGMKKRVMVMDRMQKGYVYYLTDPEGRKFHPEFKPELTPAQMLQAGVDGHKAITRRPWSARRRQIEGEPCGNHS